MQLPSRDRRSADNDTGTGTDGVADADAVGGAWTDPPSGPPVFLTPAGRCTDFLDLLERKGRPRLPPNAPVIQRFNDGSGTPLDVLRVTSAWMNRATADWSGAMACMQHLTRCGRPDGQTGRWQTVDPDILTYNAAMGACIRDGRPDKAQALFDHLLLHGPHLAVPVHPQVVTYSMMMSAWEKAGRFDKMLDLFDSLSRHGPDFPQPVHAGTVVWRMAICASFDSDRPDKALRFFDRLLEHGPHATPPVFPDAVTYCVALRACQKTGLAERAQRIFDHLLQHGPHYPTPVHPNEAIYIAAFSACDKNRRNDRSVDWIASGLQGFRDKPDTRIFQRGLGFDPVLNRVNLRRGAVFVHPDDRDAAVPYSIARAVFRCLLLAPGTAGVPDAVRIDARTEFVFGPHGGDKAARDAVDACRREQGWTSARKRNRDGSHGRRIRKAGRPS